MSKAAVLAVMDVEAVEQVSDAQIKFMAEKIFRTLDPKHPGVATFNALGRTMLSGPIQVLNFSYFQTDFPDTFRTAVEIRNEIAEHGWEKVVAFQTRNPCTGRTRNCVAWPWSNCTPTASDPHAAGKN
ncbi:MAG: hypothetical protein R3E50_10850 [Halioglobus sp.]